MAVVWFTVIVAGTGLFALGVYTPKFALAQRWVAGFRALRGGLAVTLGSASRRFVRPFASGVQPASNLNRNPQPSLPTRR